MAGASQLLFHSQSCSIDNMFTFAIHLAPARFPSALTAILAYIPSYCILQRISISYVRGVRHGRYYGW